MTDAILLAHRKDILPEQVGKLLRDSGYDLRWSDDSTVARTLVKGPESLLIIESSFRNERREQCAELLEACRLQHVPCLIFTARDSGLCEDQSFIEKPQGFVHDRENVLEWREKVELYRRLNLQARELKKMQHRLLVRSEQEEQELRSAAQIQQSLLPKKIPAINGFDVAWQFSPFEKIGGDLFNILQVDEDNVMAFLLDVSGHGISSAMVTVSVKQSLSLHSSQIVKKVFPEPPYYRLLSPAEVMGELAIEYPFERFDKFFTIVFMLINIRTGELRYSCAGHPPPLLLRENGDIEWLSTGGGLVGLHDTGPYEEESLTLVPGDRLFLYSDGLPDYCDYHGEHFGEERLVEVLTRNGTTLQQACGTVLNDLRRFGEGRPLQDDVSLLAIEFRGMTGPGEAE